MNWQATICSGTWGRVLRICGFALCAAALPFPQASGAELRRDEARTGEIERFVGERLAVWQKRLKLDEWHIVVHLTPRSQLRAASLGGIHWDKQKKTAVISVMDSSDYKLPWSEMLDDMEFTIVHELVHLELASLPRSEKSRTIEEAAVNRMAEALLNLDRDK